MKWNDENQPPQINSIVFHPLNLLTAFGEHGVCVCAHCNGNFLGGWADVRFLNIKHARTTSFRTETMNIYKYCLPFHTIIFSVWRVTARLFTIHSALSVGLHSWQASVALNIRGGGGGYANNGGIHIENGGVVAITFTFMRFYCDCWCSDAGEANCFPHREMSNASKGYPGFFSIPSEMLDWLKHV